MGWYDDIFNSAEGRLGMGLLAAAGPRADGAGFGQRLMEGVGSVDNWQAGQLKNKKLQGEIDDQASQVELRKAQAKKSAWEIQKEQDDLKRQQDALDQAFGQPGVPGNLPFDPRLLPVIRAFGPKAGMEWGASLGLTRPEVARTVKGTGPDGREYEYQVDKVGRPVDAGLPQYHEPLKIDRGGSVDLVAPDTAQTIGTFPTVVTPKPAVSRAPAINSQQITDALMRGLGDLRQQELQNAQGQIRMGQLANLGVAIGTLGQLADHPGLYRNTGLARHFPSYPGTDADTFEKGLQTFKSQSFLPILENLKATGLVTAEDADKLFKKVEALNPGEGVVEFRKSVAAVVKELQLMRDVPVGNSGGLTSKATSSSSNRVPSREASGLVTDATGNPTQANVGAYPVPPQAAINELKMKPKTAAIFDKHFGPGAAAKILGGN